MCKHILFLILLLSPLTIMAQNIEGTVTNDRGEPLEAAVVRWHDVGFYVLCDEHGQFSLPARDTSSQLEISYVGYKPVFIDVDPDELVLDISITGIYDLVTVDVASRQFGQRFSTVQSRNMEIIGASELKKAACCNLAESFETNVGVDVSAQDAVSGAKEIRMLGLQGLYAQMMVEGRPTLDGLPYAYALEYIPGPWIEEIHISKGAASVSQGRQAMSGFINTELIKPLKADRLFLNGFTSTKGRFEGNAIVSHRINENTAVALLAHGNINRIEYDHQNDGFLDMPLKDMATGMLRLEHDSERWHAQVNIQAMHDKHKGGQLTTVEQPFPRYAFDKTAEWYELSGKLGYKAFSNPNHRLSAWGHVSSYQTDSRIGNYHYHGTQQSAYINSMWQMQGLSSGDAWRSGVTYEMRNTTEFLDDTDLSREEQVPGVYTEYEFKNERSLSPDTWGIQCLTISGGLRADYHSVFGLMVIPRAFASLNLNEHMIVRASAGRGYRTANVIADHISRLASSRTLIFDTEPLLESSWNMGSNVTWNYQALGRQGSISADYYHTWFENQLIADMDLEAGAIHFYPLQGRSISHSVVFTHIHEWFKGFESKLGYRYEYVRADHTEGFVSPPLHAPHRALVSLDYQTPAGKWFFNTTLQITGPQRIPHLHGVPTSLRPDHLEDPNAFVQLNAQITYRLKQWDFYFGGENLTNYTMHHPIISSNDPWGPHFDASQLWGPVMGIRAYAGFRYTLPY
jgi:outer membrane receptor for ferrienterochelin and colicins